MSKISTEEFNRDVGARLASVRNLTTLTQADFAIQLGLSPRAYANYERGEREPPTSLFRWLCDEYRIDPQWLLYGPGDEPVYSAGRLLDLELFEGVIQLIEEWLHKHKRSIKPDKKARIIRLAYEHCISSGKVDQPLVREMLQLAA